MKKIIVFVLIFIFTLSISVYGGSKTCKLNYYGNIVDCYTYNQGSHNVVVPMKLDKNKQELSFEEIKKAFEMIDSKYRENIKNIILVDFVSVNDKPNDEQIVLASYGNGNIIFYRNDTYIPPDIFIKRVEVPPYAVLNVYETGPDIHKLAKDLMIHEVFHSYDAENKISESEEWHDICDNDKIILSPTKKMLYSEEFAESVVKWYKDKELLKENMSGRYEFISKLLEQS